MKKYTLMALSFILIISITLWSLLRPVPVFAATAACTGTEFGIATDPPEGFLKAGNLAPGDRVVANLTVKNTGKYDFSYKISAGLQAGDAAIYNILLLELTDAAGRLRYSGPLSGLADLEIGTLAAGSQEVLTFAVSMPLSAGNEVQGKNATAQFTFAARSHEGDIGGGDRVIFEHPVINNHFALKIDSTVPIKFHLVKADGSLDSQLHPDLALVVDGPGPQGDVTYTFRVSDGTLRYATELHVPHYIVNFTTRDYPVQPLGMYTARVLDNGTELGSITFQANTAPGTDRSNSP